MNLSIDRKQGPSFADHSEKFLRSKCVNLKLTHVFTVKTVYFSQSEVVITSSALKGRKVWRRRLTLSQTTEFWT